MAFTAGPRRSLPPANLGEDLHVALKVVRAQALLPELRASQDRGAVVLDLLPALELRVLDTRRRAAKLIEEVRALHAGTACRCGGGRSSVAEGFKWCFSVFEVVFRVS